jgi:hypothetical protein
MRTFHIAGPIAGAVAALLWAVGCEVDSSTADILIRPSSASLRYGETQTFTAIGGYEYRWTLQYPEWGTLSERTGPETTYTSRYTPSGTNAVANQTLTCTSTISGIPQNGGTNANSYVETATAIITHRAAASP